MRMTFAVIFCLLMGISGCSSGASQNGNRPKVYPVTGNLTMSGKPVEKAVVIFVGAGGSTARGTTDASGNFRLTTFEPNDGAVAGPQQVSVVKEVAAYDPNTLKIGEAPPPSTSDKNALPKSYGNPQTSGLTATVSENGPNKFEFALTDKPI